MFLRRCTFLLLLCLIASDANAARKTKRPVKPAKQTIPRTNVTPAPVAALAAATTGSNSGTTSEQSPDIPQLTTSSSSSNNNELPKPLVPQTETQPEPKTDKSPETDEECDPDMIGFEIITG